MGWTAIKNGALLTLAAQHFDAFITVDRNLQFQQNTTTLPLPVILLRAQTNRLADLVPLIPALDRVLAGGVANGVTSVDATA